MSWQPDDNLDLFGEVSDKHDPAQNDMSTMSIMSTRDNHAASSVDTKRTPPPSPCPQDEATTLGREVEPDNIDALPTEGAVSSWLCHLLNPYPLRCARPVLSRPAATQRRRRSRTLRRMDMRPLGVQRGHTR